MSETVNIHGVQSRRQAERWGQRDLELHYWWCRGRSDAFLGHSMPPTWHVWWAQDAYRSGYESMQNQEAQVGAE
jgi:hypothetical protein